MATPHPSPSSQDRKGSKRAREETAPAAEPKPERNEIRGPTHEQIARRAYELFLARGGEPGHEVEDWLQAERDLRLGRY